MEQVLLDIEMLRKHAVLRLPPTFNAEFTPEQLCVAWGLQLTQTKKLDWSLNTDVL